MQHRRVGQDAGQQNERPASRKRRAARADGGLAGGGTSRAVIKQETCHGTMPAENENTRAAVKRPPGVSFEAASNWLMLSCGTGTRRSREPRRRGWSRRWTG